MKILEEARVVAGDFIARGSVLGCLMELNEKLFTNLLHVDNVASGVAVSKEVREVREITRDRIYGGYVDEYGNAAERLLAQQLHLARDHSEQTVTLYVAAHFPNFRNLFMKYVLVADKDLFPGDVFRAWFSDDAQIAMGLPLLQLIHIRGPGHYQCHSCPFTSVYPNPVKIHLFLGNHNNNNNNNNNNKMEEGVRKEERSDDDNNNNNKGTSTTTAMMLGKSHQCLFCGKLYSRKYGLKIHIRTHTGYKPLICRVCQRPFGDPSNLNKHIRLHFQQSKSNLVNYAPPPRCDTTGSDRKRRDSIRKING